MSTNQPPLDDIDPLHQPQHPREKLTGEFDDPRNPTEYTINAPRIENTTEWITINADKIVFLDEVR